LNHVNSLLRAGEDDAAYEYWIGNGLADADNSEAARELAPRMAEIARRRTLRQVRAAAESGDSAALLRIWRDGGIQELGAAASLRPAVEAAGRRQEQVARLREAVEAGDAATVVTLWPQLQGDSLASMLAIQVYEILAGRCGAEIAGAIERRDDRGIIDAVRHAEEAGIAVSLTGRRASRSAKRRLTTRRALQSALATDDRVELAALAISGDLVELGSAEPGEMRTVLRALAWPHLERALESDDDQMIVAAYDAELFDGPGSMTELQRSRVNLARKRLAWLASVRAALRARDLPGLKAVLNVTPLGADRKLSKTERGRIVRLTTRDEVTERLVTALKAGNYVAIVEALNGGDAAGATLPEALAWAAVGGVVNQKTLIDAIRQASGAVPPDHTRLAKLLPAARAAGLTTDPTLGLGREFARLEHEMLRTAAAQRLRGAIAAGDDLLIMTAADPDPYGALELLSTDEQLRVSQARSAREVTARGITAVVRHEVNMATAPADSNASAVVADRPSALRSDARSSLRSLAGPGPGSGNSPRNT
ncbi:MAG: hypothetical protein H0T49_08365, partial [Chloroflexia bacterium]|nr:hypothetical protein [Chloroflexia bacterium]